jgi:glycolate dehydrogenase FAD-binding subunit
MASALRVEQGVDALAGIAGGEHVAVVEGAQRVIRVAPGDAQQIAEVLRFAHANGLVVTPVGGGSKRGWGNAVAADIELGLHRLSEVRDHAWQDMTCTVQAGCTWAAMQEQLKRHGQMVALDPLWPGRATVGGIAACNDSGALRLKYGSLRDLIIGMTLVLADGTIARSGGKVVKNVAGYDIHKLATGSFGTLGVITEVNFRLHPLEEHARTWTASVREAAPGVEGFREPLRALMDAQMVPSCVQLRACGEECGLDVRAAGPPECLDEYGARISEIFGGFVVGESQDAVWSARERLFEGGDSLVLKVSVLPDEICAVSEEARQWNAKGAAVNIVAQATGLMTVSVSSADAELPLRVMSRLRESAGRCGGSVVALRIPEELRGRVDAWGPERSAVAMMREIKRRFDPRGILNPGRFVGGI